ncbi:MAG: helix-turn-helix transcriptional regulator [Planctomycetota bacterium]
MKLADWLHARGLTPEQLRRMLGVKNRSTVHRWLSGDRVPSRNWLRALETLTDSEVLKGDFLDTSPPKCAVIVLDEHGEPRLVFPWSRGDDHHDAALEQVLSEPPAGSTLTDPITTALRILDGRARFTPRGVFLLDGRRTDARRVVAAANEVLRHRNLRQIPYPGVEVSDD